MLFGPMLIPLDGLMFETCIVLNMYVVCIQSQSQLSKNLKAWATSLVENIPHQLRRIAALLLVRNCSSIPVLHNNSVKEEKS